MHSMAILKLKPSCKAYLWGGTRLKTEFGKTFSGEKLAETWELSCHLDGPSIVEGGEFAGRTLKEYLEKEGKKAVGEKCQKYQQFPLLIKFIDAKEDLSIQVHPDDAYANANENGSLGKTECWYILACDEDARLVIGHNAKDKAELSDMIREGRWKELIRETPVKKGDFILIEPGTIHAIKGGIMVMETQQSSDITYRVYDYDRVVNGRLRELHIDKSIDVITAPAGRTEENILNADELPENTMNLLCSCESFKVWKMDVTEILAFDQAYPFLIMSVIEGEGEINGRPICKGDHFILSDGFGAVTLRGKMQLIASTI